jgi:hypothetical protein
MWTASFAPKDPFAKGISSGKEKEKPVQRRSGKMPTRPNTNQKRRTP